MQKFYVDTINKTWFDANGNSFPSGYPKFAYKRTEQVQIQLVTDSSSANTEGANPESWTKDTQFNLTGITAKLTIDNDFLRRRKGTLTTAISAGTVSQVIATISGATIATIAGNGILKLFASDGTSEALEYTAISIGASNTVTFTIKSGSSVTGTYAVGATMDCPDAVYIQASMDSANSTPATGLFSFNLTAYSAKLRETMEYSDISQLDSVEGMELLLFTIDTNGTIERENYLCDTVSVHATLAEANPNAQMPETMEDEIVSFINAVFASGMTCQIYNSSTDTWADYDSSTTYTNVYTKFRFRSVSSGSSGTWAVCPLINGMNGTTPSIDATSQHWMIGSVDTGVLARGTTCKPDGSGPIEARPGTATDGYCYLDTDNNDFYWYIGGAWTDSCHVTTLVGGTGATGHTPVMFTGTLVEGTEEFVSGTVAGSTIGDMYINTDKYNQYQCTAENTWKYLTCIRGDQGPQGVTGGTGATGPQGEIGPQGEKGDGLYVDAVDTYANRYKYDAELAGFNFLATDTISETITNATGTFNRLPECDNLSAGSFAWSNATLVSGGTIYTASQAPDVGSKAYTDAAKTTETGSVLGFSGRHQYMYQKKTNTQGDWSEGVLLYAGTQGDKGETGPQGPQGERGENAEPVPDVVFLATYDPEQPTVPYLTGNHITLSGTNPIASVDVYINATKTVTNSVEQGDSLGNKNCLITTDYSSSSTTVYFGAGITTQYGGKIRFAQGIGGKSPYQEYLDAGGTKSYQEWLAELNDVHVEIQYSEDGTNWHNTAVTATDIFMRFSKDNGLTWGGVCRFQGAKGDTGDKGETGDKGDPGISLQFQGVYSSTTTYQKTDDYHDSVSYNGSQWYYINATSGTGHAPPTLPTTSNEYWALLVQKGDTGAKGDTGDKGDPGEALDGNYVDVTSATDGYMVLDDDTMPTTVEISGTAYDIDGNWIIHDTANSKYKILVAPFLIAANLASFSGTWRVWRAGGKKGEDGEKGERGATGAKGDTGDTGATGPANTLSIGTVVSGTTASATITGTAPNQTLNLVLPKGDNTPVRGVDYWTTEDINTIKAYCINAIETEQW